MREDPGAAPAAAHGQHRFHRGIREHRHHVGGAIAIAAGERATAVQQVRAAPGDQAQRRQRLLDDVDVDRLPRRARRIDQADDVTGHEPGGAQQIGRGREAGRGGRCAAAAGRAVAKAAPAAPAAKPTSARRDTAGEAADSPPPHYMQNRRQKRLALEPTGRWQRACVRSFAKLRVSSMKIPPSLQKWLDRPWVADAGVFLLYTLLSVVFTWPLATGLAELIPAHFDPPFTAWRLGWIAHQIGHPGHLFDGNIFWPDRRTLAYSDAILLQGLLGAPFAALGVNPNAIANALMLVALTTSAFFAYLLRGAAHRTPRRRRRRRPRVRVLVLSPGPPAAPRDAVGAVDAAGVLGLAPAARHRPHARRPAVRRRGAAAGAVEPLLRGVPGHRPGASSASRR